jgi:methionine-rich copper-binding protein CopC
MKKVFAITTTLFLLFSAPQLALANSLVSTSPSAGQSLDSAPSAVTITTEAPVMADGNEVIVTDPSGIRVDDGSITIAENSVVVGLKNLIRSGIYTVSYSLLAENDIPLTGSFTFNFAEPQVVATVAPSPTQTATPSGNDAGTTIFVLGLLFAALIVTIVLAQYARKIFRER